MKQFLDSLDSGFIGVDDLARRGQITFGYRPGKSTTSSQPNKQLSGREKDVYLRVRGERGEASLDKLFSPEGGTGSSTANAVCQGHTSTDFERGIPLDHIEVRREIEIIQETRRPEAWASYET